MSELKPCPNPWCEGENYLNNQHIHTHIIKDGRCWIDCYYCSPTISTEVLDSEAEAIAAWNTRPIEDALRVEIETLKAKIKEMEEREDDQRLEAKNERD